MSKVEVHKAHALTGHKDCVYTVQAGKESKDLFSAGGDGMIVQWNLNEPELGELVAKLPNSIYALHYLNQEDLLVAGHNYEGLHLLDYKNKKELRSLKMTSAALFDVQSHNGKLLVGAGDGAVSVVDMESWSVKSRLEYTSSSARAIAISRNSNEMAIGYSDSKIRVFDLDSLKLKHELKGHTNSVFCLAYAPDGRHLVSGSRDAHLKIWDTAVNYGLVADVVAHMYTINHIAFSPDGKHFVTCSMDKSIKVWERESARLLKVIDKARHAGHGTSVNKLAWTSFNNQLVSASDDRTLSVWDLFFKLDNNNQS